MGAKVTVCLVSCVLLLYVLLYGWYFSDVMGIRGCVYLIPRVNAI